ncbi:hypothetical protein [Bradyrhizobium lablabi]|uniref:hypothetical protein n=1 Tax=Bradyrhizobium lablabi TaxID=722472 RepID=UPI0012E34FFC|nr:hypothetical protein [Bradyrhizobium lablabi]
MINEFPALPLPAPVMQQKRTSTNNNPPTGLLPGQLAVEMGTPLRLWVGVPTGLDPSGKKLLADSGLDPYVNITGDTMTGDLVIQKVTPGVALDKPASGSMSVVTGKMAGNLRWLVAYGNATAEAGGNTGSDFEVARYTDAGAYIDSPLVIKRDTGLAVVKGPPTEAGGIATKAYVDAAGVGAVPMYTRGHENIFINGDMSVSQELGDLSTGNIVSTGAKYACDLWWINQQNASAGVVAGQRFGVPYGGPSANIPLALRINCNLAGNWNATATDFMVFLQFIEGNRMAKLNYGSGAPITSTISFWARASVAGTGTFSIRNSAITRCFLHDFTIAAPNVWQYFSFVVPGCIDAVWNMNALLGAYAAWCFGAGTNFRHVTQDAWIDVSSIGQKFASNAISNFFGTVNNTVDITGLMWLPGDTPPTAAQNVLMFKGPAHEMPLVQRYFRQHKWSVEGYTNGAQTRVTCNHGIIQMRQAPTVTRVTTGTHANIRGGDPTTFVSCSGVDAASIVTNIESNAAGYTQANGFVDNLSARY